MSELFTEWAQFDRINWHYSLAVSNNLSFQTSRKQSDRVDDGLYGLHNIGKR